MAEKMANLKMTNANGDFADFNQQMIEQRMSCLLMFYELIIAHSNVSNFLSRRSQDSGDFTCFSTLAEMVDDICFLCEGILDFVDNKFEVEMGKNRPCWSSVWFSFFAIVIILVSVPVRFLCLLC